MMMTISLQSSLMHIFRKIFISCWTCIVQIKIFSSEILIMRSCDSQHENKFIPQLFILVLILRISVVDFLLVPLNINSIMYLVMGILMLNYIELLHCTCSSCTTLFPKYLIHHFDFSFFKILASSRKFIAKA